MYHFQVRQARRRRVFLMAVLGVATAGAAVWYVAGDTVLALIKAI